ncbi:MAG: hypothetical protein HY706_03630 [Candidatus Hydrogenedentes bacterium]|nr:hypothetical protein [Candidatus Hydrogenedentota bacterium]
MTGKECVQRTIAREPAAYVPLGFYVVDYDTIEAVIGHKTYVRDKIACQLAFWEGRRDEVVESFKKDTVEFYRKIDCADLITFKEAPVVPPKDAPPTKFRKLTDNTWETEDGRVWMASYLTNDITCVKQPDSWVHAQPKVEDYSGPVEERPPDPSVFEAFDYLVEHLGQDRYIAGLSAGITALISLPGECGGLLSYYMLPEVVRAASRQSVERQNRRDQWYIRPGQDGVLMEQDMASSTAPMISPELFEEFCFPAVCERIGRARSLGFQTLFHNCGNNRPLMSYFIEAGVQCYQSLQTIPDMSLEGLKRDFGDRIAFWGGIPVELLVAGTPGECREAVGEALEVGAPGGGFILGPSHSVAKGTKYDNFMATLDEYVKLRDKYQ